MSFVLMITAAGAAEVSSTVIPVSFIQNNGQADEQVLFFADAPGYLLYLTADGQILSTADSNGVVSITYPGAEDAVVTGEDVLEGKANFFIGNDQDAWVTNVPMYSTVRYEGLYEGINLAYYGGKGFLKREFIVAPGATPSEIIMKYSGQEGLSQDAGGAILIETAAGTLSETAPVCYQVVNGKQVSVPCSYVIGSDGLVTFSVGAYDSGLPLVIDPVLYFSTYFGGNNDDKGADIGLDDLGNIYIVGSTKSTNLPLPNAPVYQEDLDAGWDIFAAKMSPDGSQLIYSTYIGGNSTDIANGIAVRNDTGEVTFTGYTDSADYPRTVGGVKAEGTDGILTRLNPTGDNLVWSRFIWANKTDIGTAVALFPAPYADSCVVVGYTNSNNFTANWLVWMPSNFNSGGTDAFVIGFDPTGTPIVGRYLGGENNDYAYGVVIEPISPYNVWVTGSTKSLLFPTSTPAY
ncbi:MAG: SBBP repeat-containing protein, partial [Methanoregulaceae archaeon]|nr:SBBP repeat-containing protein [Methanoregulaceae archaeon]